MKPIDIHSFDWSGAGTHETTQRGIVLCSGRPGTTPEIRGGWKRRGVFEHLIALASRAHEEGAIVAGLDFAHSFPFATKNERFPDGSTSRKAFWSAVHEKVWTNGSTAQGYVDAHQQHFLWYDQTTRTQHTGNEYLDARRVADLSAAEAGAPANTVFKLVGANQVGKGSICGIALLEALRLLCKKKTLPLIVWPFFALDKKGVEQSLGTDSLADCLGRHCLVVVETYPSLHWSQAGFVGNRPWGNPEAWPTVREHFKANGANINVTNGDEGDALIAWYALADSRFYAMNPPGDASTVFHEGWMFGL